MKFGTLYDIKENKDLLNKNVYHVANPNVKGRVVSSVGKDNYLDVIFESEVTFSQRKDRVSTYWRCNANLLYSTAEEARANHITF